METNFLAAFQQYGGPLATLIIIACGGYLIVSKLVNTFKKDKSEHEAAIAEKVHKEDAFADMKSTIGVINEQISEINGAVQTLAAQQDVFVTDINSKMQNIIDTVSTIQKESKEGDSILESQIRSYEESLNSMNNKISSMDSKTQMLIESDKEGIRSYIIEKYYEAKRRGYIELHVLQGLELRYDKYLKENGNTYIAKMMSELRHMPDNTSSLNSSSTISNRSVKPTKRKFF